MEANVQLPTEPTRHWLYNLWKTAGRNDQEAKLTTDHLIGVNLSDHDSHDVGMLLPYALSLQAK